MTAPTKLTTREDLHVGQIVGVNDPKWPGRWIVKNLGPVNVSLLPEAGGRGLRIGYYAITLTAPEPVAAGVTVIGQPYVPAVYLNPGQIVTHPSPKIKGLHVVIASRGGKVSIAKLGSADARYWNGVNPAMLTVIDPADVLKPEAQGA